VGVLRISSFENTSPGSAEKAMRETSLWTNLPRELPGSMKGDPSREASGKTSLKVEFFQGKNIGQKEGLNLEGELFNSIHLMDPWGSGGNCGASLPSDLSGDQCLRPKNVPGRGNPPPVGKLWVDPKRAGFNLETRKRFSA